jgi:hypothetical protein
MRLKVLRRECPEEEELSQKSARTGSDDTGNAGDDDSQIFIVVALSTASRCTRQVRGKQARSNVGGQMFLGSLGTMFWGVGQRRDSMLLLMSKTARIVVGREPDADGRGRVPLP